MPGGFAELTYITRDDMQAEEKEKSQAPSILVHEHSHSSWFSKKGHRHRIYEKILKGRQINEACPCCIGTIDLDEASSLSRISSSEEEPLNYKSLNPIPNGKIEWTIAGLGSYFALSGIYFGHLNFSGSKDRIDKLKQIIKEVKDKQLALPVSSKEYENLENYKKTLYYSLNEGRFQRWAAGALPSIGSALMLSSFIYTPLAVPALAIMTVYSIAHIIKYIKDYIRISKLENTRIKSPTTKYSIEGKEVFERRISAKKSFYIKIVPSWILYGAGTAIISSSIFLALFGTPLTFTWLLFGGISLTCGVWLTLYYNNKSLREFAPKNEDRVNRQFLGNEQQILGEIAKINNTFKLTRDFENTLNKNLRKMCPLKNIKLKFEKLGYYILFGITLGIPKFLRTIEHKIKQEKLKILENKKLMESSKATRVELFSDILKEQINYLSNVRDEYFNIDDSAIINFSGHQYTKKEFFEFIDKELKNKQKIIERLKNKSVDNDIDFMICWDFMMQNDLCSNVLQKVYTNIDQINMMDNFENCGFIEIKNKNSKDSSLTCNCKDGTIKVINFEKDNFLKALRSGEENALKFLDIFNTNLNGVLIYDFCEDTKYKQNELCDHLEEKIRKK